MSDDTDTDTDDFDEALEEALDESAEEQDVNAHVLSIRRAGTEIVSIFSPAEEWSAYLEPGGGITNAFVGTPNDPVVWLNANGLAVEREEDGTYVVNID